MELTDEELERRGVTLGARGKILKNVGFMKDRHAIINELSLNLDVSSKESSWLNTGENSENTAKFWFTSKVHSTFFKGRRCEKCGPNCVKNAAGARVFHG